MRRHRCVLRHRVRLCPIRRPSRSLGGSGRSSAEQSNDTTHETASTSTQSAADCSQALASALLAVCVCFVNFYALGASAIALFCRKRIGCVRVCAISHAPAEEEQTVA